MAFKMKQSPMKRNFNIGNSPAKHKMKQRKRGHAVGGGGTVPEVTAEQVKAHDNQYGEGHTHPKKGLYSPKPKNLKKVLRKLTEEEKVKAAKEASE